MNAPIVIIRAVYFICALQAGGLLIFRLVILPRQFSSPGFRRLALIMMAVMVAAFAIWLPIQAASMSGGEVISSIFDGTLGTVLFSTRFGHVWIARLALLAVATIALFWERLRIAAALAANGALAMNAAAGHAGAATGLDGAIQLGGDMLHLLAAGAWLGGLLPFAWMMTRYLRVAGADLGEAYEATQRFSILGLVCVGVILATGSINSWFLVGSVPALIGTDYGQLLLVKIALFLVIVAVAAVNRLRLTPLVRDGSRKGLLALRRNAVVETVLGAAIIGIVAVLGTLPPAAHDRPIWPFAQRFVWTPFPRLVAAYPTSFIRSPVPYAAPSVGRGQSLYAKFCVACHGAGGRGDGPAAPDLPVKPADLTEEHLLSHSEGDLFWWISRGIDNSMPGFNLFTTENQRWDLINFLRARASGVQAQTLSSQIGDAPAPLMPDFAFETGGQQKTLREELGQRPVLLVLFRDAAGQRLGQLAAMAPRLRAAGLDVVAAPLADDGNAPLPISAVHIAGQVRNALSLFAAANAADTEYLIDPASYLRARWSDAEGAPLPDVATLEAAVKRENSVPLSRPPEHQH
jgi:putative copper resistance protein D